MCKYIQIPNTILEFNEQTIYIYLKLLKTANRYGVVEIAVKRWCKELEIPYNRLRNILSKLAEYGYISIGATQSITIIKICDWPDCPMELNGEVKPTIFESPNYSDISNYIRENPWRGIYKGYMYALEIGDMVKIGSTQTPENRFLALKNDSMRDMKLNVGCMVISPPCYNFKQLEYEAHQNFDCFRLGNSKLFAIDFELVADHFGTIYYNIGDE